MKIVHARLNVAKRRNEGFNRGSYCDSVVAFRFLCNFVRLKLFGAILKFWLVKYFKHPALVVIQVFYLCPGIFWIALLFNGAQKATVSESIYGFSSRNVIQKHKGPNKKTD